MLILNKEKEELLVKHFGFEECHTYDGNPYYRFKKCLIIYSYNHRYKGKVESYFLSKDCQDKLYDLIKENVLIKVENENKELKHKKIQTIKNNIEKLQKKLEELEK